LNARKTIWEILTERYIVKVRDEVNLKERLSLNFTLAKLFSILTLSLCIIFASVFFLAYYAAVSVNETDKTSYDYTLVKLTEQVDSLEQLALMHQNYIKNIQNIINNKPNSETLANESDKDSKENEMIVAEDLSEIHPIDSQFRKEFEGKKNETVVRKSKTDMSNLIFFPPLNGLVLKKFSVADKHFGIDIVSKKNEVIKAIADGTVILSSWTQDTGFVIAVQHKNSTVSFYKHNSVLLKKLGESVTTGEAIAVIGNSGELSDGPHLHFELWYDGTPVNPEDFIMF
jgi:murein DD-endopeptidase MepM/ murein hydrolase activator NlpD